MSQTHPFHSGHSDSIDHLYSLKRLLADLESGKAALVSDGIDATGTYVLVLKAQIKYLETLLDE